MKISNVKLLPCAHCGSNDVRFIRTINEQRVPAWHAMCYDCGMRTIDYTEDCRDNSSLDDVTMATNEAIECCANTWNTRVDHHDNLRHDDDDSDDLRHDNEPYDYLGMREVMDTLNHLCDIAHSWNANKK